MRVSQRAGLPQRQQDFLTKRLKQMESHRFLRMDDQGDFHLVGEQHDEWTPSELKAVMPLVRDLATDPARHPHVVYQPVLTGAGGPLVEDCPLPESCDTRGREQPVSQPQLHITCIG